MSEWLEEPYVPQDVTKVEMAFPADVRRLMPDPEMLPAEHEIDRKWVQFQMDWFSGGLEGPEVVLKDGIDGAKAWSHLACIQGSFQPKHEHKIVAVAYLASLWFDDVTYERKKQ